MISSEYGHSQPPASSAASHIDRRRLIGLAASLGLTTFAGSLAIGGASPAIARCQDAGSESNTYLWLLNAPDDLRPQAPGSPTDVEIDAFAAALRHRRPVARRVVEAHQHPRARAHPVLLDHRPRDPVDLLQVGVRPDRHLAEHQPLRAHPTEPDADVGAHVRRRDREARLPGMWARPAQEPWSASGRQAHTAAAMAAYRHPARSRPASRPRGAMSRTERLLAQRPFGGRIAGYGRRGQKCRA